MSVYHIRKRTFADGSAEYLYNPMGFHYDCPKPKKHEEKHIAGLNGTYMHVPFSDSDDDFTEWVNYPDEETPAQKAFREKNNLLRSIRRTKLSVETICRANHWKYFVTLTFDPKVVDSYNYDSCVDAVKNFFTKERRKFPRIKYVIVPEQHESGRWHFHALVAGCDWLPILVDSGKRKKSKIIYNLSTEWNYGFSTVSLVAKQGAVGMYISKYISKSMNVPTNRKRYFSSHNLKTEKDITERIDVSGAERMEVLGLLSEMADSIRSVYVGALDTTLYYFKVFSNGEICTV